MSDEKRSKILEYSLTYLSHRPRSKFEVESKVSMYAKRHKISQDIVSDVINDLEEKQFINDPAFVTWWLEQRRDFRPKGRRAIEQELKKKGIDKNIISGEMAKWYEKEDVSEIELAKKLLLKRLPAYNHEPFIKKKAKSIRYLQQKGFDWNIISVVIDSVL